jgi:formylglycine-generating enzyme required for sulfatase activity
MTTTDKRPLRVFLCHSSGDKPAVRELYQKLAAEGWIEPWLDEEKLSLGQHWATAIEEAIDSADIVIIFLSSHSVHKEGFVQRELNYAWELSLEKPREAIFLIPFRLDDCEPPRYLRSRQWGDYFGEKKGNTYATLLKSLKQRHEQKLRLEAEEQARLVEFGRKQAEEKARLEAEELEQKELEERIQKEAREKVRREMEERLRKEAEERARKEFEAEKRVAKPPAEPRVKTLQPSNVQPSNRQTWGGIKFVRIPAGKFLMGSKKENALAYDAEQPQHTVDIPYDYWMARFPVTNEQYAAFVGKGKHPVSDWQKKKDHPVNYALWNDVVKYCNWLNGLLAGKLPRGLILRLPTEAEWEKAARGSPLLLGEGRGGDAHEWPWGNEFDKNKCNSYEGGKGGTTPVGAYSPQGDSPFGCADMVGNVWEWTHSQFKSYPYKADDGREDEQISGMRVLRGGSWYSLRDLARCAVRGRLVPDGFDGYIGFRLVLSPSSISAL